MGFYDKRILPHLLNLAMRNRDLLAYRTRVVPAAQGRVLEIGIGSGLNLPLYGSGVREVVGLDPSAPLLQMAQGRAPEGLPLTLVEGSAEAIPLESASFDTVLTTWSLCSVADAAAAIMEIRRVLKPSGAMLFVEHGRAPDQRVARWQDRLTPLWKPIAGGCHLNRPVEALIRQSGLTVTGLRVGYMKATTPFTFMYEGRAERR